MKPTDWVTRTAWRDPPSRSRRRGVPVAVEKPPAQPSSDEFILSEAAESALADAEFDATKVALIKEAIQEGNYPLNAKRIAESFMSLERMIGGK